MVKFIFAQRRKGAEFRRVKISVGFLIQNLCVFAPLREQKNSNA